MGNRIRWVFAITIPVGELIYWWFTDWWAYVKFPEGPRPKFIMPWWWQVLVSGIVGAVAGGVLAGIGWLVSWVWSHLEAVRGNRGQS